MWVNFVHRLKNIFFDLIKNTIEKKINVVQQIDQLTTAFQTFFIDISHCVVSKLFKINIYGSIISKLSNSILPFFSLWVSNFS